MFFKGTLLNLYGTDKTERSIIEKIKSCRGPGMCTNVVCDFCDSLLTYLPAQKLKNLSNT